MKAWFRKTWIKVRAWFYALMVTLGLIVAANAVTLTYTPASLYSDGTPMPLSEIAETRLYCDGSTTPDITELGADGNFDTGSLSGGDHTCYATHVATNGIESLPSNSKTFRNVPQVAPNPPVIDQ
jgi:hypothetical protein